jgi:mRNA-degrading endonuclease toxin of MazEF toxin-antitoxin module
VARLRREVYYYDYGGDVKIRPCIVVSINTASNTVMVAEVTNTPYTAPYVVPLSAMHCYPTLTGFVRCDRVTTLFENDNFWKPRVLTLDDHDMALVEAGLRAAFGL